MRCEGEEFLIICEGDGALIPCEGDLIILMWVGYCLSVELAKDWKRVGRGELARKAALSLMGKTGCEPRC